MVVSRCLPVVDLSVVTRVPGPGASYLAGQPSARLGQVEPASTQDLGGPPVTGGRGWSASSSVVAPLSKVGWRF